MRAIDTNVLVRLIARDDERQVAAAESFVAQGAWVSLVVLVETIWVLQSVYSLTPRQIGIALEMLLDHQHLVIQDPECVAAALEQFRATPTIGFSDCLVAEIAKKEGHTPLGTFDKRLGKLDHVRKL
ncbi:MAG: type II toxin-antitoxin system VapC family toxin [Deltaproteobacteria bacterium]|nr:type II toxin-antitoxin system VapC family toxin [Deltaproteobacteria bacterium]